MHGAKNKCTYIFFQYQPGDINVKSLWLYVRIAYFLRSSRQFVCHHNRSYEVPCSQFKKRQNPEEVYPWITRCNAILPPVPRY